MHCMGLGTYILLKCYYVNYCVVTALLRFKLNIHCLRSICFVLAKQATESVLVNANMYNLRLNETWNNKNLISCINETACC